ncbi:MAG TPA: ATP-dependent helicase C-terminal domain-containing protein [Vicinamibacterales bacterium]|nr:ATP-dependent helicase C-terminal domain-containing protein [Vicinamibacterales bacterium]
MPLAVKLTTIANALPVDARLPEIRAHLAAHRAVVVSATPGAGKTTRIPPAVLENGPVILLQPRRVAARATARRIAEERRWTIGREVGWQIRFERRFATDTQLLVVTEGILTARLQSDPLLSEFTTVIFDEFHERSIHSDVGLALARQAWLARDDLRIIVMSATLDVKPVARYLADCPVVEVAGSVHPLAIEYADGESMAAAVGQILPRTAGDVLCFLPGAREIERAQAELNAATGEGLFDVLPLHGSLDGDAQDRIFRPGPRRRIVLATNIAETSLTVPRVSAVIDSGWHKVARYDGGRAIDSLTLERIPQDSADQRAGRAARLGPGFARRLWDPRQRLQTRREPEIARVDLAAALLDLLAWGADLATFEWFEAPSPERLANANQLLTRLGAIDGRGHLTSLGRQMQRIPAHPRIARILIDGGAAPQVVAACARLSGDEAASDQLRRAAAAAVGEPLVYADDTRVRHAMFAGYADRLGRRRPESPDRVALSSGHGGILQRTSGDLPGEFLVALDVVAAERAGVTEARIHAASAVDEEWVTPTSSTIEHWFDWDSGRVRAAHVDRYDALILRQRPIAADKASAAPLLAHAWRERGPDAAALQFLRRARFAAVVLDLAALVDGAALTAVSIDDLDITAQLPYDVVKRIATDAPETIALPSGRSTQLAYLEDGSVAMSVKLQELFGLADTPRLGPQRVPVTIHLLAPNGRPVQTTSDLRSFWDRTYSEVRKELRGRYPKHPWPDDPWTATPTHRTTRRAAK